MDEYLQFAKRLALEAGEIMLDYFTIGAAREIKPDNSPVTEADMKINQLVIDKVIAAYPNHGVRGEEISFEQEGKEYVWVCDPIDGTMPFVLGIPTNVFSLALVQNGVPIVAVVYDPYLKRLFSSSKGSGAFCNEEQIYVNKENDLSKILIGTSGPQGKCLKVLEFHDEIIRKVQRHYQYQCVVYEAMMVALGQFGATIFSGDSAHDIAAVKLIVEEAGGKVTDLLGDEQRYDQEIYGAIVSNGKVHPDLIKITKNHLTEAK
ncbi:MAG TPA: inositol monophosphatase [Candidatus Saccharimonadales bacterium]